MKSRKQIKSECYFCFEWNWKWYIYLEGNTLTSRIQKKVLVFEHSNDRERKREKPHHSSKLIFFSFRLFASSCQWVHIVQTAFQCDTISLKKLNEYKTRQLKSIYTCAEHVYNHTNEQCIHPHFTEEEREKNAIEYRPMINYHCIPYAMLNVRILLIVAWNAFSLRPINLWVHIWHGGVMSSNPKGEKKRKSESKANDKCRKWKM